MKRPWRWLAGLVSSGGRARRDSARLLYAAVVARAREPVFYTRFQVPDSLDGRFDMIALHAFLVLRRLKGEGADGAALGQALFDAVFTDMDRSLREMGAGDLGVGRRVKRMASGFYGRIAAYDQALAPGGDLDDALRRNLYGTVDPDSQIVASFAAYTREVAESLAIQPRESLFAGVLDFAAPPAGENP